METVVTFVKVLTWIPMLIRLIRGLALALKRRRWGFNALERTKDFIKRAVFLQEGSTVVASTSMTSDI